MKRTSLYFALATTILSGGTQAAMAQGKKAECTTAAMEIGPAGVIAPCTAILASKTLSNAERARALRVRADGYDRSKQFKLALADFHASMALDPRNVDTMVSTAWTYWCADERDKTIALIEKALETEPKNARALHFVGFLHHISKDTAAAIEWFTAALESNPKHPFSLMGRSQAYQTMGRHTEALVDAEALVALSRDFLERQLYRSWSGDLFNMYAAALDQRARAYVNLRMYDRAVQDYDEAIREFPEASTYYQRAVARFYNGDREGALADVDTTLALGKADSNTRRFRIELLRATGKADIAHTELVKLVEAFPADVEFRLLKAASLKGRGKTAEAADVYIEAYRALPEQRGRLLMKVAAAGYLRSASLPEPNSPELREAFTACSLDPNCN